VGVCCSGATVEAGVSPVADKVSGSRAWVERPLATDDRSRPGGRLASEERERDRLEDTLSLLLHQHQPLSASVSIRCFRQ